MAGLLANVAGAVGNNMAQYAHTKQRQEFQSQQQGKQHDFMRELEDNRAARAENLANRQRKWQVEDRDMQLDGLMQREKIKAQQASHESELKRRDQQVEFARADLNQVNEEISTLSKAIRNYDPIADADGKMLARLKDSLSRLEKRRAMVMESIPDDVLKAAGPLANATHRELMELREQLNMASHDPSNTELTSDSTQMNESEPTGLLREERFNMSGASNRPTIPELWKKYRESGMPQTPGSEYLINRGNF